MSWLLGVRPGMLLLAGSLDLGCSGGGRDAAPQRATSSPPAHVAESPMPSPTASPAGRRSFALYALSRAKGVPPEAREVLKRVRALLESDRKRGVAVKIETTTLGLEGETRLCAEYEDSGAAEKALARARALAKGVDLLNLVVEPCGRRSPPTERKE